jgi:AcrR family transcriptional regulator
MNEIRFSTPLRERQAEAVRTAILDALIARLERESPEDISLDALARDAGVSRRTLYRYFPSREALLAAAEEFIVGRLGLPSVISGPDEISASFLDAAQRLEAHPALARALRQTTAGPELRPPLRARRVAAIVEAMAPLTNGLDPAEARRVTAVIAYLCSSNAWVTIGDESGLPGEEIRAAVTWAIETLLADVRRRGTVHEEADRANQE